MISSFKLCMWSIFLSISLWSWWITSLVVYWSSLKYALICSFILKSVGGFMEISSIFSISRIWFWRGQFTKTVLLLLFRKSEIYMRNLWLILSLMTQVEHLIEVVYCGSVQIYIRGFSKWIGQLPLLLSVIILSIPYEFMFTLFPFLWMSIDFNYLKKLSLSFI